MAKKRKKKAVDVGEQVLATLGRIAVVKLLPGADFDALQRAERELATAAGLRKPTHRKKSLDQQIAEAEKRAAAREAARQKEEERLAKQRTAAKRRKEAAEKKAKKAGKDVKNG